MSNIETINVQNKTIRKVQSNCELLVRCIKNPDILYTGVLQQFSFTHLTISNAADLCGNGGIISPVSQYISKNIEYVKYIVYLNELKLLTSVKLSTIQCTNIEDADNIQQYKIYIFPDEYQNYCKIRLMLV